MTFRAIAATPYTNEDRATAGSYAISANHGAGEDVTPNWSTLIVEGPTEAMGRHGVVWFEWTATAEANSPGAAP